MNFADKKLVRHTIAGTIKVDGCKITRGMDSWIVSCGGKFVDETDTYIEAESLASRHFASVRDRVEELQHDLNVRQAENQAQEASEARTLGISVTGYDEHGEPTYG